MKKSFTLTASLLLGIGAPLAQTTSTPLGVDSGASSTHSFVVSGKTKNLNLCTFEICRRGSKGKLEILPIAAGSVSSLLAQASVPDSEDYLVFYPADRPRDPDSRLILRHRYLVKMAAGADLAAFQSRSGIKSVEPVFPGSDLMVCTEESSGKVLSQISLLASDPDVVKVEPLFAKHRVKKFIPNDPFYSFPAGSTEAVSYQWYLNNTGDNGGLTGIDIGFQEATDIATGAGVVIGVVDDGVAITHEDLEANVVGPHLNINEGTNEPLPTFPAADDDGFVFPIFNHGTNVAGLLGAVGNNGIGIAGAAPDVGISSIVLLNDAFDDADEATALGFLTDTIDIYNNSWGPSDDVYDFEGPDDLAAAALRNGAEVGRGGLGNIHVWAGGNGGEIQDNSNYDGYANSRFTIAVGALADNGVKSTFSENGANLVVVAPGGGGSQDMLTSAFDVEVDEDGLPQVVSQYDNTFSGTSASVPLVSGVVALMLELEPDLTWRDVQDILIRTARKVDANNGGWIVNGAGLNFSHLYGAGLVDAEAALRMIRGNSLNPDDPDPIREPLGELVEIEKQQRFSLNPNSTTIQSGAIPDSDGSSFIASFDLTVDDAGNPLDNLKLEHVEFEALIITESRSDLEIVLISPNGTQSILQESNFTNDEGTIDNWRFMTTHNWGEGSAGTWLLRITDRVEGNAALVNNAKIILHGAVDPDAPVGGGALVTSSPITIGDQEQNLTYLLETTPNVTSISVGDLPPGLVFDPASQTISGTPEVPGLFNVQVALTSNTGEVSTTSLSFIIRPTAVALGDAVGLDGIPSVLGGDLPWDFEFGDSNDPPEVVGTERQSASSSINLEDNQSSIFGFDDLGQGVLLFDWKVSSEEGFDRLWFNRGGETPHVWDGFISGERAWGRVAVVLPDSSNDVRWIYTKDETLSVGEDRGLVDNVEFVTMEKFRDDVVRAGNIEGFDFELNSRTNFFPVDLGGASAPDDGIGIGSALMSPAIGNGQSSSVSGWVEGPGTLSFLALYFAQEGDVFEFLYDGVVIETLPNLTADITLQRRLPGVQAVGEGRHFFELRYRKDISGSSVGSLATFDFDGVILDDIKFIPASGASTTTGDLNLDTDGDGYYDHFELAFGGDLNVRDIPRYLPQVVTSSGETFVEYGVNSERSDLVYLPQQSSDLITWSSVTSATLDRTEGDFEVMRIPVESSPGNESLFYRVSTEQSQ